MEGLILKIVFKTKLSFGRLTPRIIGNFINVEFFRIVEKQRNDCRKMGKTHDFCLSDQSYGGGGWIFIYYGVRYPQIQISDRFRQVYLHRPQ